jgi:hypothetical protein
MQYILVTPFSGIGMMGIIRLCQQSDGMENQRGDRQRLRTELNQVSTENEALREQTRALMSSRQTTAATL